jgi:hypothetical protein
VRGEKLEYYIIGGGSMKAVSSTFQGEEAGADLL